MADWAITLTGSEQDPLGWNPEIPLCWDPDIPLGWVGQWERVFPELGWLIAGEGEEQGAGFLGFFLKPFRKMERRNDFHDNNSVRERSDGSWRGNLKGKVSLL